VEIETGNNECAVIFIKYASVLHHSYRLKFSLSTVIEVFCVLVVTATDLLIQCKQCTYSPDVLLLCDSWPSCFILFPSHSFAQYVMFFGTPSGTDLMPEY
jgi:hypothetical protein